MVNINYLDHALTVVYKLLFIILNKIVSLYVLSFI